MVIPKTKEELVKFIARLKKRSTKELQVTYKNLIGAEAGEDRKAILEKLESKVKALMTSESTPAKKTTTKATRKPKAPKEPRVTIKSVVIQLLTDSPEMPSADLIKAVKERFPDSKFDASHVAWYRNKFKKGELK